MSKYKDLRDIPPDTLKQIYFKLNQLVNFIHVKYGFIMNVKENRIIEIHDKMNVTARSMVLYCILHMKYHKWDIAASMSVELDYEVCKSAVTTDKAYFYKAIKDLEELGFLLKYKPKRYIINPYYFSILDDKQINHLRNEQYAMTQEGIDGSFISDIKNPNSDYYKNQPSNIVLEQAHK